MMRPLFAILLLAAGSALAGNDCAPDLFDIDPPRPTTEDVIRLRVRGTCGTSCTPHTPRVELNANGAVVHFGRFTGCIGFPSSYAERIEIGRLPAGTRDIVLMWGSQELARKTVTVADAAIRVQPRFGTAGTEVLLTPRGASSAPEQVLFGGIPATSFLHAGPGSIVAVAPPHEAGLVDVTFVYRTSSVTAPQAFDYRTTLEPSYFAKFLFPLTYTGPGAFGSQWRTDNFIYNRGPVAVVSDVLPNQPVAPGARLALPTHEMNRGLVVGIPRDLVEQVWFSSHARDLSRNASDAGTELRVVNEHETRSQLVIPGLHVDPKYRYQLRVYDIDGVERDVIVLVRDVSDTGGGISQLPLRTQIRCVVGPCITNEPAFGALDLGPLLANANSAETFVSINAGENDARIWAFISATNNETQRVTTYTPQH